MEWEQSIAAGVMASSLPLSGTPRKVMVSLSDGISPNVIFIWKEVRVLDYLPCSID